MASNTDFQSSREVQLNKMCPQQRARYQAYLEPCKEAQRSMRLAKQRVCAAKILHDGNTCQPQTDEDEKTRQDVLFGQLKAAEARCRIRQMRLNYHNFRAGFHTTYLTTSRTPLYLTPQHCIILGNLISLNTFVSQALSRKTNSMMCQ